MSQRSEGRNVVELHLLAASSSLALLSRKFSDGKLWEDELRAGLATIQQQLSAAQNIARMYGIQ